MKEKLARRLVRLVGWSWDRSYGAYVVGDRKWEHRWSTVAKRLDPLRKLAVKIDFDNATEQMAREGWWG